MRSIRFIPTKTKTLSEIPTKLEKINIFLFLTSLTFDNLVDDPSR